MKKATIVIATHKYKKLPKNNLYLPIFVGACKKGELKSSLFVRDDLKNVKIKNKENISHKNNKYSELTALYASLKFVDTDYIGLCHYRRFFKLKTFSRNILNLKELSKIISKYKIILPKKRNYYIESLKTHYENTHSKTHLKLLRKIIKKDFKDYSKAFRISLNKKSGYMFNMFIMEKSLLKEYSNFLFNILEKLEKEMERLNFHKNLSDYEMRLYGRLAELLLNVWIYKMIDEKKLKKEDIKELPTVTIGKRKYFKKVISFFSAKFFKIKYTTSF